MHANQAFAIQLSYNTGLLQANTRGIRHAESLRSPSGGGSCLNWIVGHLLATRDRLADACGASRQLTAKEAALYARGTQLENPETAIDLDDLLSRWSATQAPIAAWFATLDEAALDGPAPFSPGGGDGETLGSLLSLLMFHEAYHVGQTGLLRRTLGHAGASG